ncbi:unnamed protein product [Enterobius vermicularis]|uniref:Spermatogenesis associated 13 n=1 Tax=Enterobius vermicularis TaxID=51028 RepID=A0A0N4V615_ENTVE|nr:unnamed protein product [Enterobius vermicularis]
MQPVGSLTSRTLTTSQQSFQQFNEFTPMLQSCRESATSLPALSGRSNFMRAGSWPKSEYEAEVASPLWQQSGATKEVKGKYVKQSFRSSKTGVRGTRSFRDKKFLRRSQQRWGATESPTVKRSSSTREENWDRAKRIIGSSRRSSERSSTTLQSRSLDRLVTLQSNSYLNQTSKEGLEHEGAFTSGERISRLDLSINVENNGQPSTSNVEEKTSPIPGLVKLPREKFNLKKESHSFAKNLRRLITGSYSKYDGEKNTHSYIPRSKESDSQPHGLEAAIDKGRARFIEAQRRGCGLQASGDSLCRNEHRMQHSSASTTDTFRRNMDSDASSRTPRRHTVSCRTEDLQDSQPESCPSLSSPVEPDIKLLPPPIPERTYKKRLKPDEIGTTRRDPETSMNQKVAGKLSTTEPTTSYMMVNEAADEFLGKLNQESAMSAFALPYDEIRPQRRTFGLHFYKKNCHGDPPSTRRSKGSIIKRVFF